MVHSNESTASLDTVLQYSAGAATWTPLAPLLTLNGKAAVNTLGRGPSAGATEGRRETGAERWTSPRRTSVLDTATSPGLT